MDEDTGTHTLDAQAVAQGVADWLRGELPDAQSVVLTTPQRAGGGLSTENWLFDMRWRVDGREQVQPMVLRCASGHEIVVANRTDEFDLLRGLQDCGLPTPRAFWMDAAGRWFGRPAMLLERLPGRAERALLTARGKLGLDEAARTGIATQMAEALAALHAVDADRFTHFAAAGTPPALRELALQERAMQRDGLDAQPELVLAACWLRSHLPPACARETVVHGDWRPANMLVDNGRLSAILDWELAHRGDPAEDLGWYLAGVYRGEHFIPGAWEPADFLRVYEERSGTKVDARALRFWSVFALFKLGVIAFQAARALAGGDSARLGPPGYRLAEALMRALAEAEA